MDRRRGFIVGIFSRIFSKNTESNSNVRKWVTQEIEKVDTTNPDIYTIFVGLIQIATQWGKNNIEMQNEKLLQSSRHYLGDATIFEITCYTYHRLEKWLAKNRPDLTSEITLSISQWIVEKFAITFYLDQQQVSQIVRKRVEQYRTLAVSGNGLEEIHLALEQHIVMTKGDRFDQKQLSIDLLNNDIHSQYITLSLEKYEEIDIPVIIDNIKAYCSKNIKKQLGYKQSQEQNYQGDQQQQDYLYGTALLVQEDWVRACKAFSKVLSANPKHYKALVQRGLLYMKLHQPLDAIQDFTIAIGVNPNQSAPYLHRGKCYHRNFKQGDKSLADYSTAIGLEPRDAAAYFSRGELYDERALYDEGQIADNKDKTQYVHVSDDFLAAINDYSQVIALEPEHDGAYVRRGLLYARKSRMNKDMDFIVKSISDLERAMILNWENGYLYKQQDEMKELLENVS